MHRAKMIARGFGSEVRSDGFGEVLLQLLVRALGLLQVLDKTLRFY